MMSFFTAQAQPSQAQGKEHCCFWVENMQPVTAQHIANLNGTGVGQDTSAGNDLVLNNVLNKAIVGNTDVYTLHFPTEANCGNKVSIEWLVYRDGQLLNGNLSQYAELGIYTRYDQLNANGECQNVNWLGGIVEDGDGLCGCNPSTWHVDHNDFPGAREANPLTPAYFDETHHAAGYQHVMYTYNFDYFYLPFLASNHSTTNIIIKWKQVGNYSLVVRVRERLGGTDYDFTMDGSQNPSQYIGGHQSCCGEVLYQDSLHYLVTTASEKSICEDEPPFPYGRGLAWGPNDSTLYDFYPADSTEDLYYVLFGDYVCDHWVVERIDTLQLYARINPDIVAQDTDLCRNENFNAADLLSLVTEVDLDAPGIIGHEIRWSENGVSWTTDMSRLTSLNNLTVTAGKYEFYVRQYNFYYDAMDQDTIGCGGDIDTVVVNVRDLFPPILDTLHTFTYCNEELEANSPLVLPAHLDTLDFCSTEIRWYTEDDNGYPTHAAAYLQHIGDTLTLDLTEVNPENKDYTITYFLYAYSTATSTYSAKYDSVTFVFHMTPEFIVDSTQLDFVVCPGASVTMNSMVSSIEPNYNDSLPTVTYAWYSGDTLLLSNDTNYTVNASMVCNQVDTYTVKVTAVSFLGCRNEMTRVYTIKAQDIVNPIIAWVDTVGTVDSLTGNRLVTVSGCDSADVPTPYRVADFLSMRVAPTPGSTTTGAGTATATSRAYIGTIIDGCSNVDSLIVTDVVNSHTACQTIVTRTYVALDACGNRSNAITEIITLNNDFKPVITGRIDVNPVRDTSCTYDVPSYAVLRNIFDTDTNIHVTYNCPESAFDTVVFYMNNTDVVADGNLNIFADTDLVTIYAVVTDTCGNNSLKTPVYDIHKPAPMYIAPGSITLDTLELCADVTTNMHFNDNFVFNADRPYTYQWSQISIVGQSIITPDSNNYLEAVVAPESQLINTSSHFIMTVTDSLGCVASDTSNAIHFYRLPDVTISSHPGNTGNPINDGDTLCPNYGNFYVIATGNSNLPDSVYHYQSLAYAWSGAADLLNPYLDYNMFKMACENCDTMYQSVVTATNMKNCSSTATFHIYGYDKYAPVVTAISDTTLPLVAGRTDCVIFVPDFTKNNTVFNVNTVSDDCFSLSEMTFKQDTAEFYINHDTIVTVTITTPCGEGAVHQIHVRMPDNLVHITDITADKVGCEPLYDVTLTPTIENIQGTPTYLWSNGATTETITVTLEDSAHTFTLTVTDGAGCASMMTVSPTVYRAPVREDFEFTMTPNTYCSTTEADGTFTITVLNDSTAHIAGFLKEGDVYDPYRPLTYTYEGLFEGAYNYTIFTSDGCSRTFTDSVTKDTTDLNAPFSAFPLHHNYKCESPYEGSVKVVPGIENYVYQISSDTHFTDGDVITNHDTVNTPIMFNWLYQDIYRVFVVSPKGCHFVTNDVEILDITDTPTTHVVRVDTADCTINNGVLYVLNTNPTYTYSLQGVIKPGNNGTISFNGLAAGEYNLTIASSGICTFVQKVEIPSWSNPGRPVVSVDTNRSCTPDFSNGAFTIAPINVKDGYTYKLYTYETTTSYYGGTTVTTTLVDSVVGVAGTALVFDSLADGSYQWMITDDHNCTGSYMDTIPYAPFQVDTNKINIVHGDRCDTANNVLTIVNPDNNYYYVLYQEGYFSPSVVDTFPASGVLLVQEYGTNYFVRKIHKQLKCFADNDPFDMNAPVPAYNFTVAHTPDHDCSALGTGTITVNTPSANYSYYLYEGKAYNSYSYYANMDATYGTDYLSDNATSFTGLDGNGYYNYQIYTIFAVNNTTACANSLYDTIRLDSYTPIITNVTATPNYMCDSIKNGTITVTLDSVVAGNFYLKSGSTDLDTNTTGAFTGLNSGAYSVYFESAYHCQSGTENAVVLDSAFIEPQFVITPNYSCDSTLNLPGTGCIYVVTPHGVPGVDYDYSLTLPGSWSDRDIDMPSYKWCALSENNYVVNITDLHTGCSIDTVLFVPYEPLHVTLDIETVDNSICENGSNGSIKVTATSDNLDAQMVFTIDGGTTWHPNGSTITGLATGNYEVIVKDTWFNCTFDTCANRFVDINTVKNVLTIVIDTVMNTACEDSLFNGSIVISSVKYADGTNVGYTASIMHSDSSAVTYATEITNGWGHLNGLTYLVTIKDTVTGCDTTIAVPLTTNNVCSPDITITAINGNKNTAADAKHFYFCYGATDGKLVATANSTCDTDFSYEWTSVCAHSSSNTDTVDIYTAETFCCTYYVTAIGATTGCTTTDSVTVCIDTLPMIVFTANGPNIHLTSGVVNPLAGDPTRPTPFFTNCENYEFNFGIVNPGFDSIAWNNGFVGYNVDNFDVPANSLTPGTTSYCVWVEDHNGCTAGFTAANVITLPIATETVDTSACGTFHYVAQNGTVIDSVYNAAVTYPFTIIDTFPAVNGCDSIVTKNVTLFAVPTASITDIPMSALYCHGDTLSHKIAGFALTTTNEDEKGIKLAASNDPATFDIEHDEDFDIDEPMTRSMNGMYVYGYAANACDTVYAIAGQLFIDSLPQVTGVTSTDPRFCAGSACPGTVLDASVVNWNATTGIHNTQWLVSATTDFTGASIITTAEAANDQQYVNFAATNHCGTTYATPVQITVVVVTPPTIALATTTFCAGDVIDASDITITHTSTTATPVDTTYKLGDNTFTPGTTKLKATDNGKKVSVMITYDCGSPISSDSVAIVVNDTARMVVTGDVDTLCVHGAAYDFTIDTLPTNIVTITPTNATYVQAGATVTVTPVAVGTASIEFKSEGVGGCGTKTVTKTFIAADTANNFSTIADVNACDLATITLTAPTYTANGNVHAEGWLLDGVAFDPTTTPVQKSDSGKTLTYVVTTICGDAHSPSAILHVYDTAKLVVTGSITNDTLCVNDSYTFTIDTNATNIVTVTTSSNISYTHTGANVQVTALTTGDATLTINSKGKNGCGEKTEVINFVVSDLAKVSKLDPIAPVCEGEALSLTAPTYTNGNSTIHSEGWQVKKTSETAFSDYNATDFTANAADYKNAEIRYMVETFCGPAYSDTLNITVNDTAELSVTNLTQTVCNNSTITAMAVTRNKAVALSNELTTAGLGFNTDSTQVTGTVVIPTTETFPYTLSGIIYTTDAECPDKNDTLNIEITVNEAPVVTLTRPVDTICAGSPITITSLAIDTNHTAGLDAVSGYKIKKSGETTYSDWDITANVDVTYDLSTFIYAAKNGCGVDTSDFFTIYVAGHSTVAIDATMFRDTCSGQPFSDFLIGDPTVTLTGSAVAQDTTWYIVEGTTYTAITDATIINNPTSVACVVTNQCFSDTSNVYDLVFDGAPTITPKPLSVAAICEGELFTVPTFTVADNGGLVADTLWFIDGSTLDFTTAYAATYDGKEIKLIVNNACGADTAAGTATINVRPIPEMMADTVLCADPANEFTLQVVNGPFTSYSWKDANGTEVATTATYTQTLGTALAVDTVLTYYVVVEDGTCPSTTQINVGHDTLSQDLITVRVTSKPFFKFTDMSGVEKHDIKTSINNTTTAFKWTVDDKCITDNSEKVYVQFSIYYNGTLIPETEIHNYIQTASYTDMYGAHSWNTSQFAEYTSHTGSHLTDIAYYTAMSNHYPHSNLSGAAYDFDWLYLHFVSSRYFTNTISKFIQPGDYEIHYELHKTDGSLIDYRYNEGTSLHIGGRMYTGSIELLASDVFTIHVDDGPAYANNEAPELPEPVVISDEPTVKVYPNPATENVNVRIEGINGQTTIRISTLTGNVIAQRSINIDNKFRIEPFSVSDLTPGVYVIQIINEEAVISRKLVITK